MDEKVVYLAFNNENVNPERHMLACAICRNKTFTCRTDLGQWPTLECAACQTQIGSFGWAQQESA